MCVPWELNSQPFALLKQCSTTEPQELFTTHTACTVIFQLVWVLIETFITKLESSGFCFRLMFFCNIHYLWCEIITSKIHSFPWQLRMTCTTVCNPKAVFSPLMLFCTRQTYRWWLRPKSWVSYFIRPQLLLVAYLCVVLNCDTDIYAEVAVNVSFFHSDHVCSHWPL